MSNFFLDTFTRINEFNLRVWERIAGFIIPPANAPGVPPNINPPPNIIPQPGDQPTISPPPRVIYVPVGGGGSKPDVDITVNPPPTVPPRRLPKEADGQSPTKTPKKHSISIKTALYDEIHGELLTFPLTNKKAVFERFELDGFAAKMKATLELGANAFGIWLAHERGDELEEDVPKPKTFDGTALITPSNLAGLSGEVGLIYGLAPLTTLASAYQVSRVNARQPVTGYVPLQIEFNSKPIPDPTPSFLASPEFQFSSGLAEVKKAVGVGEFPVFVPRSLIQHTDEELDRILDQKLKLLRAEKGKHNPKSTLGKAIQEAIDDAQKQKAGKEIYRTLDNIPQQVSWMVQVLDEVLGSFPVSITLKDSDLIKVGEEEQKIRVPNIAESLAELQGLSLLNHSATELSVNMLVRILAETGTGRQQSIKNYYLLDVLRDYLGCATKEVQIKAPFAYDPLLDLGKDQKDEFAKFLTPKEIDIDIEELDEKHSIQRWLTQVDQIYALCRAYMTRPARDKETVYKYLKDIASQFVTSKTDGDKAEPDDFDKFLEQIEQGFVNEPGNTLDGKPYGREFTQRPRIVRLSQENDAQEG